jgi:hypothetical protein
MNKIAYLFLRVLRLKSEVIVNNFIFHYSAPQNFAALLIETIRMSGLF